MTPGVRVGTLREFSSQPIAPVGHWSDFEKGENPPRRSIAHLPRLDWRSVFFHEIERAISRRVETSFSRMRGGSITSASGPYCNT